MKPESFLIAFGNQRQLLTQGKYFELERSSTPQEIHQGCDERDNYSFHTGNATRLQAEMSRISTSTEFLVGTGNPVLNLSLTLGGQGGEDMNPSRPLSTSDYSTNCIGGKKYPPSIIDGSGP